MLPNTQDQAIAQARANRDEARQQATRIDEIAKDLESKGPKPDDPRSHLAADLRDLAAQLRSRPEDLEANLARLGTVEAAVNSQLDPGNEQRASTLTALNRALSRAASGRADANQNGDPKVTAEDLRRLGEQLDAMTPEARAGRVGGAVGAPVTGVAGQRRGRAGAA